MGAPVIRWITALCLVGSTQAGTHTIEGCIVGVHVQAGLAWFFRRYAKELPPDRRLQYADIEAQAQAERRGLWADAESVAPWDWRATKARQRREY